MAAWLRGSGELGDLFTHMRNQDPARHCPASFNCRPSDNTRAVRDCNARPPLGVCASAHPGCPAGLDESDTSSLGGSGYSSDFGSELSAGPLIDEVVEECPFIEGGRRGRRRRSSLSSDGRPEVRPGPWGRMHACAAGRAAATPGRAAAHAMHACAARDPESKAFPRAPPLLRCRPLRGACLCGPPPRPRLPCPVCLTARGSPPRPARRPASGPAMRGSQRELKPRGSRRRETLSWACSPAVEQGVPQPRGQLRAPPPPLPVMLPPPLLPVMLPLTAQPRLICCQLARLGRGWMTMRCGSRI